MNIKKSLSLITIWLVSACGAHAGVGTLDSSEYQQNGHQDTTLRVAQHLGLRYETALRLAYFSQVPDQRAFLYSAPMVGVWGIVWPPYRQKIMDTLHSLHGGDNAAVLARRERLAAMIASSDIRVKSTHWKIGFLIHALGDSFAHVREVEGQLESYSPIWGHMFDNGKNDGKPDVISSHRERYEQYVDTLCRTLVAAMKKDGACAPDLGKTEADYQIDREINENWITKLLKPKPKLPVSEETESEIDFGEVNAFLTRVKRVLDASPSETPVIEAGDL